MHLRNPIFEHFIRKFAIIYFDDTLFITIMMSNICNVFIMFSMLCKNKSYILT